MSRLGSDLTTYPVPGHVNRRLKRVELGNDAHAARLIEIQKLFWHGGLSNDILWSQTLRIFTLNLRRCRFRWCWKISLPWICQFRPAACGQRSVLVYGLDAHELDPVAVDQAIEQGAVGIITERLLPYSIPQCLVPDARHAFATLSHAMAGSPTKDMLSIGVMGTHGKTTTSLLISAMLKQLGGRVGYRTTLGVSNGVQHRSNAYCDPNSNELSRWLKSSLSKDCPAVILELTDRMLTKRSASGLEFDVLVLPSLRLSQRVSHLRDASR